MLVLVTLGAVHSVLQWWGNLAWFRLELVQPPVVWWETPSSIVFWLFGGGVVWALVVAVLADSARDKDRDKWVWRWGGLAIVATICFAGSYIASRNGMALYEEGIAFRSTVLSPLEIVKERDVAGVVVTCEMVRKRRRIRRELIDRPTWYLILADGRSLRVGGVRGAGIGNLPQDDWLIAMQRLSAYPRWTERISPDCVDRVVERFPSVKQPFVRSMLDGQS